VKNKHISKKKVYVTETVKIL